MNRQYIRAVFEFAICLLFVACAPVPVPSGPTSDLRATDVPPLPTLTITVAPSATDTSTPLPTDTPLPPPLEEIFPQVNGGHKFVFINSGGLLTDQFVPNSDCIHSGEYGLQLIYDMKGQGNGGWGVQWNEASGKHFVASSFNAFTFWVKGASGGETFQIGLKDTFGKEVKVESVDLLVVAPEWMTITAPFSLFEGVNTASIENINIGFNSNHGSGTICVDDIAFAP